MIKALAIKEMREVLGIAFLGMGAELFLVAGVIGLEPFAYAADTVLGRQFAIPFLNPNYFAFSCIIASVLALALGFRQSAAENVQGRYQFLLHRPIRREAIFLTKLGIGLAVFLVCTSVPILLYAFWAAIPGTHPSPFEWSMTEQTWQACVVVPLLYLGAFLCGLRPARWFGTRLLPLAPFCLPVILLTVQASWPWPLVLPALAVVYAALVSNICHVASTRDFS